MRLVNGSGVGVLNEIVRESLVPSQPIGVAAQTREFLLKTEMEIVHFLLPNSVLTVN
jgi:hypothetical protein